MSWTDPKSIIKPLLEQHSVEAFAEALLVAAAHVKKDGKCVMLRFGNTMEDEIDFARQIATIIMESAE